MTISARTRVVVLLTSVALALVLLLAVTVAARADGPTVADPGNYVTHTVRTGDTLWDIALEHADGGDLRNLVHDIRSINGLDTSTIQPGQVLRVPVP
jgi:nucleoid-associated protein YgaU